MTEVAPTSYYGLPAVKPAHWGWLVAAYLFVGGLAGSAQVIAAVIDVVGTPRERGLVRTGRYLALAGAVLSPVLLIADLHMPSRWYNMLRIFRRSSPMSIGSWALFGFGSLSGLAALAQALSDVTGASSVRRFASGVGVGAAALGGVVAVYTGSLLSATATPLWSSVPRLLPASFGIAGTSTALAALSLAHTSDRLRRLALVVSCADLTLSLIADRMWQERGLATPLDELAPAYRAGALGAGTLVPIAVHGLEVALGRHLGWLSHAAAVSTLVGGFAHRAVVLFAGRRSAERPADYFRVSQ